MTDKEPDQTGTVKNIKRFVSFVGIALLLLSQLLVFSTPFVDDILIPPYTLLAIVGIALVIVGQWIPSTPFSRKLDALLVFDHRVFWMIAAISLSVIATVVSESFARFHRVSYIPVLTIWLLAAAAYVYAFLSPNLKFDSATAATWFKAHALEILSVLLITLLAATLRFYRLGEIPGVLDGDEGLVGMAAKQTVSGQLARPFALWENFGSWYLQLINLSMDVFGATPLGLRFMAAVGGTLAISASYLLARQVGGTRIALVSAVMLAVSHTHIHFSRIASVAYIQDTWLVPLELYLLLSGLEKREAWRSGLAGIVLAIHYSFYLTSQIITILLVLFMLIAFISHRAWLRERRSHIWTFWGGFLITVLPWVPFVYKFPNLFIDRLTLDGTFQNSWLALQVQSTGQSAFQILFQRFVHAFLSLTYYPAFDFYGSPVPMMSVISSVLLFIGLGFILWQIRNPSYLLLNGYFWGGTMAVGVFALPPSADSYRMLLALPAAIITASVGLDKLLDLLSLGWNESRTAYTFTATAVLISLLAFNVRAYYGEFANQCLFIGDVPGRYASYLGSEIRDIEDQNQVYVLSDETYRHGTHASTGFLSQDRPVTNVMEPLETLTLVSGETVIATPNRIAELQAWALEHPGGKLHYVYDCENIILLSYRIP